MPVLGFEENILLKSLATHEGKDGELYLTNKRLIFECDSGLLRKQKFIPVNLQIDEILNVTVEGIISKTLVISARSGEIVRRYEFKVKDPYIWASKISDAFKNVTAPPTSKPIQIEIKKLPLEPVTCKYCGTAYFLKHGKCPNCGAPYKQ